MDILNIYEILVAVKVLVSVDFFTVFRFSRQLPGLGLDSSPHSSSTAVTLLTLFSKPSQCYLDMWCVDATQDTGWDGVTLKSGSAAWCVLLCVSSMCTWHRD